jgi:uncharacterized membrane protein
MERLFKTFAGYVALGVEAAAVVLIAIGALEALLHVLRPQIAGTASPGIRRAAWMTFAMWLLLGLEFELGADVIRTAISPSWTQIGQLGAIATIRTVLNYFLAKDVDKYSELPQRMGEPQVKKAA